MINKPLNHKEPHTYKDLCTKKYSTVPNHDGSVPGEKQSILLTPNHIVNLKILKRSIDMYHKKGKKKGMTKKAKPMKMKGYGRKRK